MALLLFGPSLSAQRGTFNYYAFSKKTYYFGITLGYNSSRYQIQRSETLIQNDSIRLIQSSNGPGFNLGIVTNIKFGENMDLRFNLPTLSFAERRLEYTLPTQEVISRNIESVFLDFPIQFRYKSKPYHDVRAFFIVGAKYSLDLASNSRARKAEDLVRIQSSDILIEYGVGLQFFFPYFILSPEIKFSHGINNIHSRNDQLIYSRTIDKLFAQGITISVHFEG
ncbi:porin family protein [Saprospira sp. CCB-QB6]|uniref:type IX secretion/gliding motility protein PorT/SprT n=1 Tax=Saprospira sp. CCB-QB6 TaxID=3023936 RepID=UPI00234B0ED2|nr:porin family protein [Saprospira sp. CCB-QB6]WCL82123.1 porin family protein [Saprospira sp. CCB-QB6]